jgi:hypothetical protein
MTLGKHKFRFAHQAELDRKTRQPTSQTLKLGDREIKLDEPQVFIADATAEKLTLRPVKVALPTEVPDLEKAEANPGKLLTTETLLKAVESLRKDSAEIRDFLGANTGP